MDKISKRSKGYAFVEYTTEEAAANALREMNGKVIASLIVSMHYEDLPIVLKKSSFHFVASQIINGWMITVDVAKTNPPKFSRGQPRTTS